MENTIDQNTKATIDVLPYNVSDLSQIKTIFFSNVPEYFAAEEWDDLLEYLKENHRSYFVTKIDNRVVGCGGYHYSSEEFARLSWDFIHPDYKGKGIGRKLIEHCLLEINTSDDIRTVEVWTSQHAFKFYGKFNFHVREVRENFWAENLHLYRMEKVN